MGGEVIKQFLVSLGFDVDDNSLNKFTSAIANSAKRVAVMAGAIKVAGAGIFYGISKISQGFEDIGYQYRIIAPAINKAILLRQALMSAYKDAGVNIVYAVRESVKFNMSLTKTKYQLSAIAQSVGLKFIPMLTKQMDIFRTKIKANMPEILKFLESFVTVTFKAVEILTQFGVRLWGILSKIYDGLVSVHKATDGWSTVILAVLAAWKLLNLSFLATPFGMLLAGIVALIALYDDFQVWKEGGESYFNWARWVPAIDAFNKQLEITLGVLKSLWETIKHLFTAFGRLLSGNFSGFFDELIEAGKSYVDVLKGMVEQFKNMWDFGGKLFDGIKDGFNSLFGEDAEIPANVLDNTNMLNGSQPLGANTNTNNNQNQSINQQTQITINGASDPNATARAIGTEQTRVNFNLARNMKGAAR